MATRCKFSCVSKREFPNWDRNKPNLYEYEFTAVHSDSKENELFFAATPNGLLKLGVIADGTFVVGASYYLDIIKAL